ncbi:MBOAT family O-acyltransferase [Zobellia uliginosa]|uniref:MBOAT family O-acyltransferase n=1 Tax=Zobellia uliginosa TaxID=143224 RepID=UPI0026E27D9D|nr:MBOAT family O-acyltransferase [Zobellia uliginosa]MDO6518267.1 MBOAT family O-acyltransferase [Zobellia uliginosa]
MLFNSVDFAIFLPLVFFLYWFVFPKKLKLQNLLIVLASYAFYGWWDWRFLSLIAFSTIVDYSIGRALARENGLNKRNILLWTSILVNLGFLGFFKYYNFFLDSFTSAFSFFGQEISAHSLNIILPVGISFYTFQTLSYTIDVYRKQLEPTRDFIAFSAFVCFFPQLVAGPIERASHLLPQFYKKRVFDYSKAVDGMRQILWGLFKKIVIADNCAEYANEIFNNSGEYSGSTLLLGAFFFTFQIYGDFSGYSDIAIGTSRLFGFDLMKNFAFPYFSRDIAEFWRRWHISLSTWFRDYLYIPLGGSRGGTWMKIRNIFIIFLVSGFWHGANWTFLAWGALNAIYFLPLMLSGKNRQNITIVAQGKYLPNFKEILQIGSTFLLTILAWVFFRAGNVAHALRYLVNIFDTTLFSQPQIFPTTLMTLLALFVITEWLQREKNHGLEIYGSGLLKNRPIRWGAYIGIIAIIFSFGGSQQEFIYFQF